MTAPVLTADDAATISQVLSGYRAMAIGDRNSPDLNIPALIAIAAGQTRVIQAPSPAFLEWCRWVLDPESNADRDYHCAMIRDLLALIGEKP